MFVCRSEPENVTQKDLYFHSPDISFISFLLKMNPQYDYPPPPPAQPLPTNQSPPPSYSEHYNNEKIRPPSGWKDLWAFALWLCNLGAFIAVSVLTLRTYRTKHGSYGGTSSTTQYSGIVFDTDTVKIFGYSAIVGFGFSLLYFLLTNAYVYIVGSFYAMLKKHVYPQLPEDDDRLDLYWKHPCLLWRHDLLLYTALLLGSHRLSYFLVSLLARILVVA